ncbi:MAG TPA: EF-P lysine aminoacylase EpmA [Gammaproteobacteria bacterium]|nr:EF-P lysine aminoacylase EpmA [Gammaproteobacteria bacterium]
MSETGARDWGTGTGARQRSASEAGLSTPAPSLQSPVPEWRPTAPLAHLKRRAELLAAARAFFAARGVMEVQTPLLSAAGTTDVHLASVNAGARYLHTSPEFAMKRLLAAGSGDIYQICRVFRGGEAGRRHNPEFTLLEWYRVGFDHHRLMDEVVELVARLLPGRTAIERITYRDAFVRHANLDPFAADIDACRRSAARAGISLNPAASLDVDGWLDLIGAELVYPRLGRGGLCFVYDYPPSQAALARVRQAAPPVAERFEVFVDGVELANGYHELTDAAEQRRRFEADIVRRRELGLPQPPVDERLLAALEAGIPDCAGVALGFDRLTMLAVGAQSIDEVIAFPHSIA